MSWKSDDLRDLKCFLKVFDKIQNGGKSHLAQNDVIGCVELVLIQGFQRYLICEIWANGSKVIMLNALQTHDMLVALENYCTGMIILEVDHGTVLNMCAKI